MSTRKSAYALSELWSQPQIREGVTEGNLRLKLPIDPSEYPDDRTLASNGPRDATLIGPLGDETIEVYGRYLVVRIKTHRGDIYLGAELDSVQMTLEVLATKVGGMITGGDLVPFPQDPEERAVFPYYKSGDAVLVHQLDHNGVTGQLAHSLTFSRKEIGMGEILGGVFIRTSFGKVSPCWLVQHNDETETIGIYTPDEIALPASDWLYSLDLYVYADPRHIKHGLSEELFRQLIKYFQQTDVGVQVIEASSELDQSKIEWSAMLSHFKENGLQPFLEKAHLDTDLTNLLSNWIEHLEQLSLLMNILQ